MEAEREEGMTWVEPFVGSAKVIAKVSGDRIGSDVNKELISLMKAIQTGWSPPRNVTEAEYNHIKNNQHLYSDHLKGFVSFACSFGGKRFDGYARNKRGENYAEQGHNSLMRLKNKIKKVLFVNCDYQDLKIPERSLIYCDPPYINTEKYDFEFNHEEFYQWCIDKVKEGHRVFISEYESPFEEVWSQETNCFLKHNKAKSVERLFRVHKAPSFSLRKY